MFGQNTLKNVFFSKFSPNLGDSNENFKVRAKMKTTSNLGDQKWTLIKNIYIYLGECHKL